MSKHLSTPRRARGLVASFAAVALGFTGLVAIATSATATVMADHCSDITTAGSNGWAAKVDTPGDPATVAYTAPTGFLVDQYCVKAGQPQNGGGAVIIPVTPASASVTIDHPTKGSVSHYVVHLVPAPTAPSNATLAGQATCADRDGNFTITWTLTGDTPSKQMTGWWTNASTPGLDVVGGGAAYTGSAGNIFVGPYNGGSTQTATTSHNLAAVPGASVTVEGKVIWNKGQASQSVKSVSTAVPVPTGCAVAVTPPAAPAAPTCDAPGTFTGVDTADYTWSRSEDAGTGVVTLTAVAVGYVTLTGQTVFASGDLRQLTGPQCEPAELPGYVTVAWRMPGWVNPTTPTWPQTYFTSVVTTSPDLDALDDRLELECGDFQIDVYFDDEITEALIEGGFLNGPSNPPESLIAGGWGVAYKLVHNAECTQEQPVRVPVEPAVYTVPTCLAAGTLVGVDTEDYEWVESGFPTAATLTATPIGEVELIGQTVYGPYDLTKLTGEVCLSETPIIPQTPVVPTVVTPAALAETGFPLLGVLGLAGSFSLIGGGLVNARRLLRKSA